VPAPSTSPAPSSAAPPSRHSDSGTSPAPYQSPSTLLDILVRLVQRPHVTA
jgi:hypothetical protein